MNALITATHVHTADGTFPHTFATVEALAQRAAARGYFDLHFRNGFLLPKSRRDTFMKQEANGDVTGRVPTALGSVYLHGGLGNDWTLDLSTSRDAAAAYDLFIGAIGCRKLGYSPRWRGVDIIGWGRQLHPERFTPGALPEANADRAPDWLRELPWTARGEYLHVYDIRAAYLAAARSVYCGAGEYAYQRKFNAYSAGLWACVPADKYELKSGRPCDRAGWYDTASVRAAIAMGQPIKVEGGYVWKSAPTVLRPFCDRLNQARNALVGNAAALSLLKRVYTRTLGALATPLKGQDWYHHPQWWYAIVAESGRRIWDKVGNNAYAFGIHTDSVYVAHSQPDPVKAFPLWGDQTRSGPGSWRYVGSTRIDRALLAETKAASGSQFAQYLKTYVTLTNMEVHDDG